MKRILTIGRDYSCDIHINDGADIVSRNHATLEIGIGGKYYITDTSSNGTYVNGMRIPSQQRYEITREDEVSFAHAALLEWNMVPRDKTIIIAAISVVVAIVVAVAIALSVAGSKSSGSYDGDYSSYGEYTPRRATPKGVGSDEVTPAPKKETPEKPAAKEEKKPKKSKKAESKKEKPATQEKSDAVLDPIY